MFGPYFLVAPIYQNTKADSEGNDIRNGIYFRKAFGTIILPETNTEGNRVINNFAAPIWKLPLFRESRCHRSDDDSLIIISERWTRL